MAEKLNPGALLAGSATGAGTVVGRDEPDHTATDGLRQEWRRHAHLLSAADEAHRRYPCEATRLGLLLVRRRIIRWGATSLVDGDVR